MKDASAYLKHIREAIVKIEKYTEGGRKTFSEDTMIQDSVIRNLEIIGEAARNLPVDLRKSYPKVPWRSMMGMRNVLIHEYFGVDLDIVWKVVAQRLPVLKRHVSAMLAKNKRSKKKA
jgi:uncharacterized protein with HEPN domain